VAANILYCFEHELRQYPNVEPVLEALAKHANRLVLAGGRESKQHISYQPNTVLAAKFGRSILDLPGGHAGCVTHPTQFACGLLDALEPLTPSRDGIETPGQSSGSTADGAYTGTATEVAGGKKRY
jgi:hypothetical protein